VLSKSILNKTTNVALFHYKYTLRLCFTPPKIKSVCSDVPFSKDILKNRSSNTSYKVKNEFAAKGFEPN
jgi:hypothetical protein